MSAARPDRPFVRVLAFAALGLYGTLRWGTLAPAESRGRLFGVLALALLVCGLGPAVARRSRLLAALAALAVALSALAVAGIPVPWITHLRVAVASQWIGNGIAAIPGVLTPYKGSDHWVLIVLTLGAAVLLLDGAIVMAFAPSHSDGLRKSVAALPLIALAAIPAALVASRAPYLEGLALFALLATFMWGERVRRDGLALAILLVAVAGGAALALAPELGSGKPWLDYQGWANRLGPGAGAETFDWSQRYGPIDWPRTGRPVLAVKAARADYWKAENVDGFDGRQWTQAVIVGAERTPPPSPAVTTRFSQRITVTIRGMSTTAVIGAGSVTMLTNLPKSVVPGVAPGTWTATSAMDPGASYQAQVYSPHPAGAELRAAGANYAGVPSGYLTLELPQSRCCIPVVFGPFHSGQAPVVIAASRLVPGEDAVHRSPYGGAFSLAQRLAAESQTPYDYVKRVIAWLDRGHTYDERPPSRRYPLESFLFRDRVGYCQQFAGAMALLLRMGGVPARVAVGFTPGTYDAASRTWVVTDMNAHAWVEAWFPSYGWVRFDPTPAADPALKDSAPAPPAAGRTLSSRPAPPAGHRADSPSALAPSGKRVVAGRGSAGWEAPTIAIAVVALVLVLLASATRPLSGVEPQLGELERAFRRTGRALAPGTTLAQLERQLHDSPAAAAYVQRLRLSRFSDGKRLPSASQRRALRAHLAAGLGLVGRLRALWALPPRRRPFDRPHGA